MKGLGHSAPIKATVEGQSAPLRGMAFDANLKGGVDVDVWGALLPRIKIRPSYLSLSNKCL